MISAGLGRIELKPEDVAAMFEALRDSSASGAKSAADEAGETIPFSGLGERRSGRDPSLRSGWH